MCFESDNVSSQYFVFLYLSNLSLMNVWQMANYTKEKSLVVIVGIVYYKKQSINNNKICFLHCIMLSLVQITTITGVHELKVHIFKS